MAEPVEINPSRLLLKRVHGGRDGRYGLLEFLTHDMVAYEYDFCGDAMPAEVATAVVATGVAGAILADQENGVLQLGSGAADNDSSAIGLALNFKGDLNAVMMCRVKVDNILLTKMEIGWTDVLSDAGAGLVLDTPTINAADFAIFAYDVDATTDEWHYWAAKTSVEPAGALPTATGQAPVNATYETFIVALRGDFVRFIRLADTNNTPLDSGWIASGIEGGTAVTPWIYVASRSAATRLLDIDFLKVWQRREA